MLAKPYRLPIREKFNAPQSITTQYFRILAKSNNLPYNRFGFVISKKVDKRAVVRNRLRRVLSEVVSENTSAENGKDFLFIVKTAFTKEQRGMITDIAQVALKNLL